MISITMTILAYLAITNVRTTALEMTRLMALLMPKILPKPLPKCHRKNARNEIDLMLQRNSLRAVRGAVKKQLSWWKRTRTRRIRGLRETRL